ncbi:hypothetical protein ACFV1L_30255 [Kitasatospora sp. NPDC059646]|uniref:hypothetical protein n=1 Tax=Kitasatospora sp. NPDC059646 TaxID=3346893 RepID=UPI00369D4F94
MQVRPTWQAGVQHRVRRQTEQQGFTLHVQARHGCTSAAGPTHHPRSRHSTEYLPGDVARRLYATRGAGESEQKRTLAGALQEHYFKDHGHRAAGLTTELTGIARADIEPR